MLRLSKPKVGSARTQIDILDVSEDLIHLKNNRYRLVLKVSSINFELKSEDEKDIILSCYESFLNSVDFPIQILIRTRTLDIDEYLDLIKQKEQKETNTAYKTQLKNHRNFVKSLIKNNKILTKNFYIIIPFDSPTNDDINLIREQINVRADIIEKNLARLSINSKVLKPLEIIDLFYSFYNPQKAKIQPLSANFLKQLKLSNYEFF